MTAAKIGRSMKKREKRMAYFAEAEVAEDDGGTTTVGTEGPVPGAGGTILPGLAVTFVPGRARWTPSMMTRSSVFRPDRTTRRPSTSAWADPVTVAGMAASVTSRTIAVRTRARSARAGIWCWKPCMR